MTSDAQLLALGRRDPAAFRELYDRYAERIHDYHRRRAGPDAALDLTAETFARAWLGRSRFRDEAGGSAAPWLFAIARNVLLESVRTGALERGAVERLRIELPPAQVTPEESWLDGADELLDGLPPAQREALRLRVLDDLPYDRVAARLGTTPATARVRVHRGLGALRARLSKTTPELPS
jgi:RNA polymerase sigma-70 factor (ECF subfamily)